MQNGIKSIMDEGKSAFFPSEDMIYLFRTNLNVGKKQLFHFIIEEIKLSEE